MFTKQPSANNTTNRYFQLRFAQEKFNDFQWRLMEAMQSVHLQFSHMQKVGKDGGQHLGVVDQARRQFLGLEEFLGEERVRVTEGLLGKQMGLEEQAQRRDIIRQYEQRITQLDSVIYMKEVDIAMDHIGKLHQEKPTQFKVRKLTCRQNQINFTIDFLHRITQLRRSLTHINPNPPQQIPILQSNPQCKTQSTITKQSSSSSTSSSCSYESNPQIQKKQKQKRHKKMLVINSQSKIYEKYSKDCDPQMVKMALFLDVQKKRQEGLGKQYGRLRELFKTLCEENRELAGQYRKMVGRNRERVLADLGAQIN